MPLENKIHIFSSRQRVISSLYIIANKNKRLLIKENVFLDLFAMVFEEHNFQKSSIISYNLEKYNFSIIWPKKEPCYRHNMLPLISQSIKAYEGRVEIGKMGKIQKAFSSSSRPPNLQALSFYYVLVGCVSFKRLKTPQKRRTRH